jgi:hypothetical protein
MGFYDSFDGLQGVLDYFYVAQQDYVSPEIATLNFVL